MTFTDALEMKGVTKFFPGGEAAVEALIAGNDMLCLPESVPDAIEEVKKAIKKKRLSWDDIDEKLMRVLHAKYQLGLNKVTPIELNNLLQDLNAKTDDIRNEISRNTFTMLASADPLPKHGQKIAYVGLGASSTNLFGSILRDDWNADVFTISYKEGQSKADDIAETIKARNYDAVVIGVHDFALRPANNYNISNTAIDLWQKLQSGKTHTIVFGNVYATKNFCSARNLIAAYQDDDITQKAAADLLFGKISANGKLPVSVCQFNYGAGMVSNILPSGALSSQSRFHKVDSLIVDAIQKKAFPGAVVLAAKDGELIYHKAFGNYRYEASPAVTLESIFDLASVTKISATTIAVMKMFEEGKIELNKTLGDYLPWVRGSNKENLKIRDILLHEAGLVPFIPFYRETIDSATGTPFNTLYTSKNDTGLVRVAENLYLRKQWNDTMISRILNSPLGPMQKYVYSDNDFIFLGKIIEEISGMTLDQYVRKNFYDRMGMATTGFLARKRFPLERIVPTEEEKHFRQQLIWGDVHDEGASMFGGIAGHAGLFSTAYDLSMLYQMLLNGGEFNGTRYLQAETIKMFTSYQSKSSRRGLGFDKPEKDNNSRNEPYPATEVSDQTFGHTGFTGTCVWVDPKYNLVYIFLSNRVYPTRNNPRLSQLNVRANVQDAIYEVIKGEQRELTGR